jgi:hypothetical protein
MSEIPAKLRANIAWLTSSMVFATLSSNGPSSINCVLSSFAENTLKVGITLPQAGQQATRGNVIHMAQNAECERFDSLCVFERLLWPINPQTPYVATPDGSLPNEYQIMLDPL